MKTKYIKRDLILWFAEYHPFLWVGSILVKKNDSKIPEGPYCYDKKTCPYLSKHMRYDFFEKGIVDFNWCSYCRRSEMILLDDCCKICGINDN